MKTLHKTLISIITVAVLGISVFAQPANADTNAEFKTRLSTITQLLLIAEQVPAYRGQIISLVAKALQELSKDIKDMDGKDDDCDGDVEDRDLDIEVEIKNNKAYVELEINGKDYEETYNETNHQDIIEMIAEDFDLDENDVEDAISFDDEDEEDEGKIELVMTDDYEGTAKIEFQISNNSGKDITVLDNEENWILDIDGLTTGSNNPDVVTDEDGETVTADSDEATLEDGETEEYILEIDFTGMSQNGQTIEIERIGEENIAVFIKVTNK